MQPGLALQGPGPSRLDPAIGGCLRNHGETASSAVLVLERSVDAAVPELLVTVDASGVDTEQDSDTVPSPEGDLGPIAAPLPILGRGAPSGSGRLAPG